MRSAEGKRSAMLAELNGILESQGLGGLSAFTVPVAPEQLTYANLLNEFGYSEEEVARTATDSTEDNVLDQARRYLDAIKDLDAPTWQRSAFLAYILLTGKTADNAALWSSLGWLQDVSTSLGYGAPPCGIGVFPTFSCNAQVWTKAGQFPVILIDQGMLDLINYCAFVIISNSDPHYQVSLVGNAVDRYVRYREMPDQKDFESVDLGPNSWGRYPAELFGTATVRFVIGHELGHIVLGHLGSASSMPLHPTQGKSLEVALKSDGDEFEADAWAISILLHHAEIFRSDRHDTEEMRFLMAVGGSCLGLSLIGAIEVARLHHQIEVGRGHPKANLRVSVANAIAVTSKAKAHVWLGQKAISVMFESCRQLYPQEVARLDASPVSDETAAQMEKAINIMVRR
jgi:hypothetical protein